MADYQYAWEDPNYYEKVAQAAAMGVTAPKAPPLMPEEKEGLLSKAADLGLGALHYVGGSLEKAFGGRAIRGLLGGKPREGFSIIPFSDFMGLTREEDRVSGEDLLKQWGLLEGEGEKGTFELRDLAGPALEMALDPASYITGLGAGRALTSAGKAAEKAGTLAPTWAGRMAAKTAAGVAEPQAGWIRFGVPLTESGAVLGTGPWSQKAAEVAGTLGDKLLYSGPGLVASRLFAPAVKGTTTEAAQRAMRASEPEFAAAKARGLGAFVEAGRPLEEAGVLHGSEAELRAAAEGTLHGPPSAAVDESQRIMQADLKARLDANRALGVDVPELADPAGTGYFPRQRTPFAGERLRESPNATRDFPIGSSSDKARLEEFKGIPGASLAINEMYKDPQLRAMLDASQGQMNQPILQHMRSNYVPLAPGASAQEIAANEAKIKALSGKIFAEGKPYEAQGLDYFGNHPITDYGRYVLKDEQRKASIKAIHDMYARGAVVSNSLPPDGMVSALDALEAAGLEFNNATTGAGAQSTFLQNLLAQGKIASVQGVDLARVHIPEALVADATRVSRSMTAPEAIKPLLDAFDSVTNLTKTAQTTLWPSFHTRNTLQMLWQNFVGGARDPEYHALDPRSWSKPLEAAVTMRNNGVVEGAASIYEKAFPSITDAEATRKLLEDAFIHSARAQHGTGLAGEAIGMGTHELPGKVVMPGTGGEWTIKDVLTGKSLPTTEGARWNPLNVRGFGGRTETGFLPAAYGGGIGNLVDDLGKLSAFYSYMKQGYEPAVAAARSNALHYGGQRLTDFERGVMQRIIPFYGWSKFNLPQQAEQLLATPGGKTAQAIRFTEALKGQAGFVPESAGGGLAIPIGKEDETGRQRFLSHFGLPFEDFTAGLALGSPRPVTESLQKGLGMTNPLIKGPLELVANKQFYSGRALDELYSQTGNRFLDQVLMNTPLSRAMTTERTMVDPRKDWLDKLLYAAGPAKVTDVDMEKARQLVSQDVASQLLKGAPGVRSYTGLTVRPEDLAKLSPEQLNMYRLYQSLEKDRQKAAAQAKLKAAAAGVSGGG